MDLGLDGHAYVITGGASGLGFATAQKLVSEGARVLLSGRTSETLQSAVTRLGAGATHHVVDNGSPGAGAQLVQACLKDHGRVDGVLISVGGPPKGSVMDTTSQAWQDSFETIFLGALDIARTFAAELGPGGSIALVLSSSAKSPLPQMAISNGLRAGLAMVAKTLAEELGPRDIRVNMLLPGRIDTARLAYLDESTGDPEGARRRAISGIPLGRYGSPAEFGNVATFLLSPAASYVTGVALPVDGGLLRSL
jgi:3-oxoacyl-[acyl-carrier protein] reductase